MRTLSVALTVLAPLSFAVPGVMAELSKKDATRLVDEYVDPDTRDD